MAGKTGEADVWQIVFVRSVRHDICDRRLNDAEFIPSLLEVVASLEADPFQYPVKTRELAGARAAALSLHGDSWRLVYDIDEYTGEVIVLALEKHDQAYKDATRRRR